MALVTLALALANTRSDHQHAWNRTAHAAFVSEALSQHRAVFGDALLVVTFDSRDGRSVRTLLQQQVCPTANEKSAKVYARKRVWVRVIVGNHDAESQ